MKKTLFIIAFALSAMIVKSQNIQYILPESELAYKTANPYAPIYKRLNKGDTVLIYGYNNGYWTMDFKGSTIYVFEPKWSLTQPLSVFKSKVSQERIKPTSMTIGMFASDVSELFGNPTKKNTSTGEWGIHEQWVYDNPYVKVKYVYIENGKVTSWQE